MQEFIFSTLWRITAPFFEFLGQFKVVGPVTVLGKFTAEAEEEQVLRNTKNTYPTGGTPTNANVERIQHLSPTGSVARRFVDEVGIEQGGAGYQNGRNVASSFFLTDYVFNDAARYTSVPAPATGNPPGNTLSQQGFYLGVHRQSRRVDVMPDWTIVFRDPLGNPQMKLNPNGSIDIYGPVTFHGTVYGVP